MSGLFVLVPYEKLSALLDAVERLPALQVDIQRQSEMLAALRSQCVACFELLVELEKELLER